MFILVYQVPKVVFYFKVKRWLQLFSCGMTRNITTMVAWCLPALLAASIITCLPGIDIHLHKELLSPPGRYFPSLSIPHGDLLCLAACHENNVELTASSSLIHLSQGGF